MIMHGELVSVIMPTHNSSKFQTKCDIQYDNTRSQ